MVASGDFTCGDRLAIGELVLGWEVATTEMIANPAGYHTVFEALKLAVILSYAHQVVGDKASSEDDIAVGNPAGDSEG